MGNKEDREAMKKILAKQKKTKALAVRRKDVPANKTDTSPAPVLAPGPVTPEKESERVLISHQGAIVEARITDRTQDGKFTKIDNVWRETASINIIHKLTAISRR